MKNSFIKVDYSNVHVTRYREIIKKYPEVRKLFGPNNQTLLWILVLSFGHLYLSYLFRDFSWPIIFALCFFIGAVINHSLYVLIHECCHNLAAKNDKINRIFGMICDFPLIFPSAMAFRKYHLIHHRYLNEELMDPDIPLKIEAQLIGTVWWRKALWLIFFSVSQALRPMKFGTRVKLWDRWVIANMLIQLSVSTAIWFFLGPKAFTYLLISTLMGLGLHPLGGRWIQEHFVTAEGQETYSYYGPLNHVAFNIGYHNEHHDFMNIPYNRLPDLKRMAPEYYQNLKSYRSWTIVVLDFIFNSKRSAFDRIVHPDSSPGGLHR
jgi:sphingolipid 4-desaturase/C4-monooxygenase